MTHNIDWNLIGLSENPFSMSPPDDPSLAKWADMEKLKQGFISVFKEAKGSAPTQVVLCRGPVGGGKTHASLYFGLKDRWPSQDPSVKDIQILRVPTPKEVGKPDRDFYIDVIEHVGLENIRIAVRNAVEEVGKENAKNKLQRVVVSADLANALLMLLEVDENPLLSVYFLGKCTNTELRKLGLNRNLEKTQDYFRMLAGVFQCFIGLSDSRALEQHNRVCLWMDEMEDFIYFSPSQYRPFGQGLRELVDRIPFFFTLFMNFTLTSPEEYEEIELILGTYLIDRVTQSIFFDELEEEEKIKYVSDLLALYGTEQRNILSADNPYYPFEEEALSTLLLDLPRRTPRDVNKRCRVALLKAYEGGLFEKEPKSVIDREFVLSLNKEEIDREIG